MCKGLKFMGHKIHEYFFSKPDIDQLGNRKLIASKK